MGSVSNEDLVLSIDGWGDIGPVLTDNHHNDESLSSTSLTNGHVSFMDNPYACFDYEHETASTTTEEDNSEEVSRVLNDLKKYIELLPHTPSSLNALLDAEHNSNEEKAWGLLQYYKERPQLVEYTLEKELPRMEYTWIDAKSGEFIQDKSRVAVLLWEASLSDNPSLNLLPRCANQSLLADLLQFLTTESDNSLIRTHFHTAVTTQKVDITLMPSNGTVLVKATLNMSLPHPSQSLVNIATVNVSAQFSPVQSPPLFHYHVESVELVQPVPDEVELREMAVFLQDLPSFVIEEEDEPLGYRTKFDKRRDAVLQKTQTAWKQVNSGLQQTLLRLSNSSANNNNHHNPHRTSVGEAQQQQQQRQPLTETKPAMRSKQLQQQKKPLPEEGASSSSGSQKALPNTVAPLISAPQQREPSTERQTADASPPPSDGTNGKTPNLQKSFRRIRDAQKATWKKQVSRLKSAASANSFRQPSPLPTKTEDKSNSSLQRATDSRPSMLEQAASRLRLPQRSEAVHKQTPGQPERPVQQPRNDEDGPKKWNNMLQSRLMRLSSKNSSSAASVSTRNAAAEEPSDDEWVFTSEAEISREDPSTAPPSDDDDSARGARSPLFSNSDVPSLAPSFSSSTSSASTASPVKTPTASKSGSEDGSLLFQGSDVWGSSASGNRSSKKNPQQPQSDTSGSTIPIVSASPAPRSKENNSRQGNSTVAPVHAPSLRRKWPSVRPPRRLPQAILKFVPSSTTTNNNNTGKSQQTMSEPSDEYL